MEINCQTFCSVFSTQNIQSNITFWEYWSDTIRRIEAQMPLPTYICTLALNVVLPVKI